MIFQKKMSHLVPTFIDNSLTSGIIQNELINSNIKQLKKNEIFLDIKLISRLFKMCDEDSELISIFTTLNDWILDSELYFVTKSQIQEISEFARQFLSKYLLKHLLSDILKYISVIGIVPIMVTHTDNGDKIPIIPHYETGIISVYINRNRLVKYRWWDFVENRNIFNVDQTMLPTLINSAKLVVNKRVRILSGFQYDPRPNGRLCSLIFSCTKSMNMIKTLERNLLISDNYASNPLILFQDVSKPPDIPKDILIGTYADSGDCATDTLDEALSKGKKYIRDQETLSNMKILHDSSTDTSLNLFKKAMHRYIQSNDPNNNAYKNNLTKIMDQKINTTINNTNELLSELEMGSAINHYMLSKNAIPVPNGLSPVTIPHPTARTDFENLVNRYEKKFYKAFGIPVDIYSKSGGKKIKMDIVSTNENILRTVIRWKEYVEYVITTAYQMTYMENLVGFIFNDYLKKRNDNSKFIFTTHEDIIKGIVNDNWFKIDIQLNTRVNMENLMQLYGMGIISWTEVVRISRSNVRLGQPSHIVPQSEQEMLKHTKKRKIHPGMEYDNGWIDLETRMGFFTNPNKKQKASDENGDDKYHNKNNLSLNQE